jgi:hypothetical protein
MKLVELLEQNEEQIVAEANTALERAQLKHYQESGAGENRLRLHNLYRLVLQSLKDKNLIPLTDYIQDVAAERFRAGFDVYEVHTAINVLEETIWQLIIKKMPPAEYAGALGLISTALGAGKTCLAQTYVSLASKTRAPSMDLSALFKGTEGI